MDFKNQFSKQELGNNHPSFERESMLNHLFWTVESTLLSVPLSKRKLTSDVNFRIKRWWDPEAWECLEPTAVPELVKALAQISPCGVHVVGHVNEKKKKGKNSCITAIQHCDLAEGLGMREHMDKKISRWFSLTLLVGRAETESYCYALV